MTWKLLLQWETRSQSVRKGAGKYSNVNKLNIYKGQITFINQHPH